MKPTPIEPHKMNLKIIELGLEQDVLDMHYLKGWAHCQIGNTLRERGVDISDSAVLSFLTWVKYALPRMIAKMGEQDVKAFLDKFYGTSQMLIKQLQEIEEKISTSVQWKEDIEYRKLLIRLIDLVTRLRGEIKTATTIIDKRTVNIQEMTVAVKNEIVQILENEGELSEDGMSIVIRKPELVGMLKKKKSLAEIGGA
jgi:hypothetical protein